jgi:hypothetical protein
VWDLIYLKYYVIADRAGSLSDQIFSLFVYKGLMFKLEVKLEAHSECISVP